jgi:hypothetical protein
MPAGARLAVHTWVPEFTQRSTPRRYLFVRENDGQLVVQAETRRAAGLDPSAETSGQ